MPNWVPEDQLRDTPNAQEIAEMHRQEEERNQQTPDYMREAIDYANSDDWDDDEEAVAHAEELEELQHKLIMQSKPCRTPGAVYKIICGDDFVKVEVQLPFWLDLTEDQAKKLESKLHHALEDVLAEFFE